MKDERPLLSGYLARGDEGRGLAALLTVSSDGEDYNVGLNEETQVYCLLTCQEKQDTQKDGR